jgi:hypothetical protein
MPRNARIALVVAVVAAAVVAFIVASPGGGGGKSSPAPIPVVRVKAGKPVGGIKDITVKEGGRVRFTVVSDVADEIHVHGYDLEKDVRAHGRVSFSFPGKIDGIFVIELESRSEQIAQLEVTP